MTEGTHDERFSLDSNMIDWTLTFEVFLVREFFYSLDIHNCSPKLTAFPRSKTLT